MNTNNYIDPKQDKFLKEFCPSRPADSAADQSIKENDVTEQPNHNAQSK